MKVEVFCDGAVSGNPGPGGWGVLLRFGDKELTIAGGELNTTNNRMELMGAITALESLKRPCDVILTTDSEYVLKGITEWWDGWAIKGRLVPGSKKVIANLDLWLRLKAAVDRHRIDWRWVRGHTGDPGNECADKLAGQGKKLVQTHGPDARLIDGQLALLDRAAPEIA